MTRYFYLLLFSLAGNGLKAQDLIDTDRPDQSDGTHIVEKKHVQVETGLQYSKLTALTRGFDNVTLIRYGVSKRFELRLLNQYSLERDSGTNSGLLPITVSCKNLLCKEHGWLPELTLVSYFHLPITLSNDFRGDHFGYSFVLAGKHGLGPKLDFCSNIGMEQDQQSTDISYPATAELNYSITDRLSAFIEYFGSYALHSNASNGMDLGLIYTLKKNIEIDLAMGSPTMKTSVNRFISFGFSARLPD